VKKILLASVAAISLLAATNLATAQGMKEGGAKADAPAAKADPKGDESHAPAAKPMTQENKVVPKASPQHAEVKAAPKAEVDKKADVKPDPKAPATAANPASKEKSSTAEKEAPSKTPATAAKEAPAKTTTGAAVSGTASAAAAPPAEKRTQIVSAIKQEKVQEVTNVNFNISIGTAVPSTVRYYPIPRRIVEIYPEWDGYDFILVHGQYIILRPHTHEIVYIIEG
jgi:hypothetical protein